MHRRHGRRALHAGDAVGGRTVLRQGRPEECNCGAEFVARNLSRSLEKKWPRPRPSRAKKLLGLLLSLVHSQKLGPLHRTTRLPMGLGHDIGYGPGRKLFFRIRLCSCIFYSQLKTTIYFLLCLLISSAKATVCVNYLMNFNFLVSLHIKKPVTFMMLPSASSLIPPENARFYRRWKLKAW